MAQVIKEDIISKRVTIVLDEKESALFLELQEHPNILRPSNAEDILIKDDPAARYVMECRVAGAKLYRLMFNIINNVR